MLLVGMSHLKIKWKLKLWSKIVFLCRESTCLCIGLAKFFSEIYNDEIKFSRSDLSGERCSSD